MNYLTFDLEVASPSKKTLRWNVASVSSGGHLGQICWWAHWRKYCFFPIGGFVLDSNCLKEISTFCDKATLLHKKKKK